MTQNYLTDSDDASRLAKSSSDGAMSRRPFAPGSKVFARWQGPTQFEIIGRAICDSTFPHWICKSIGVRKSELWIIPEIHLSYRPLCFITGTHNQKPRSKKQ
jgi:hypothetical protein